MKNNWKFSNLIIYFLTLIYFLFLFININYYQVPHGDIFQYIGDAENYSNFKFPGLIQLQPLTPLLMAAFRPFFSGFEFPYFATAKFLNIIAVSASLIFVYKLINQYTKSWIAIVSAIVCALHPLTIVVALDITTIGLYSFFVLAALYFLNKNKKIFFLMSALAFLVRIEGLILLFVYFINESSSSDQKINCKLTFKNFKFKKFIKNNLPLLIYSCLVFLWTIFQTLHNLNNKIPYGNYYLFEFAERSFDNRNFIYIFGLLEAFFLPKNLEWWTFNFSEINISSILLMILSITLIISFIFFKKTRNYGIYIVLLGIVHSFFPAVENRYFALFLQLFIVNSVILFYEIFKKNGFMIVKIIYIFLIISIFTYLGFFFIRNYQEEFAIYRDTKREIIYTTTKYLFNYFENEEYFVISSESFLYYGMFLHSKEYLQSLDSKKGINIKFNNGIITFEMDEKKLNFVDLAVIKNECSNSSCLLEMIKKKNAQYIIINDWLTENHDQKFWINKNGVFLIRELMSKKDCLKKIAFIEDEYTYKEIMSFDLHCYQNLN